MVLAVGTRGLSINRPLAKGAAGVRLLVLLQLFQHAPESRDWVILLTITLVSSRILSVIEAAVAVVHSEAPYQLIQTSASALGGGNSGSIRPTMSIPGTNELGGLKYLRPFTALETLRLGLLLILVSMTGPYWISIPALRSPDVVCALNAHAITTNCSHRLSPVIAIAGSCLFQLLLVFLNVLARLALLTFLRIYPFLFMFWCIGCFVSINWERSTPPPFPLRNTWASSSAYLSD